MRLVLGVVATVLPAAGLFLLDTARAARGQQDATRHRLAEAEALLAGMAVRDHELRNVVAGLSGAARVLTGPGAGSVPGGRELLVAAGAELIRLQRMLDVEPAAPVPSGAGRDRGGRAAVGPVLRQLALLHRANGMAVRVRVDGDPHAGVDDEVLAQVVANLLANCARHAPGAQVRVHAAVAGSRVRIEVADDGPGPPAGPPAHLLRRGVRGSDSTGLGIGLSVCAELLERHGGRLALTAPGARGCTAVFELPAARCDRPLAVASA